MLRRDRLPPECPIPFSPGVRKKIAETAREGLHLQDGHFPRMAFDCHHIDLVKAAVGVGEDVKFQILAALAHPHAGADHFHAETLAQDFFHGR